jgi:hypothetical protein
MLGELLSVDPCLPPRSRKSDAHHENRKDDRKPQFWHRISRATRVLYLVVIPIPWGLMHLQDSQEFLGIPNRALQTGVRPSNAPEHHSCRRASCHLIFCSPSRSLPVAPQPFAVGIRGAFLHGFRQPSGLLPKILRVNESTSSIPGSP